VIFRETRVGRNARQRHPTCRFRPRRNVCLSFAALIVVPLLTSSVSEVECVRTSVPRDGVALSTLVEQPLTAAAYGVGEFSRGLAVKPLVLPSGT